MFNKSLATVLICLIFCLSFLSFIWMIKDSACEVTVKSFGVEVAALLDCKVVR
ncbi:Hok/Gef family protein [Rouxiella sp. T17]|uniref:Hok/Gef family protein n=1 Tax=Rouxiella sp. T17 TaxID=3085684 RepID=UPI002FC6B954